MKLCSKMTSKPNKLCNDSPKQKNRMDTYISDRSSTICSSVKPFCVFHCPLNTICCIWFVRALWTNFMIAMLSQHISSHPKCILVIPRYPDAEKMTATFFVFFTNICIMIWKIPKKKIQKKRKKKCELKTIGILKLTSFFYFSFFCCYLCLVCHVLIPYAFCRSVMPSIKTNASFVISEKHTESHWENCGRCYDTRCATYNHNSCPIVTFGRGRFIPARILFYLLLLANVPHPLLTNILSE